ncbi:MAG: hypothetical protein H7Y36_06180 [Armatimonadetes bacterium]|nr:hypothetical protein [Akkermansiaceae bacterium]
MRGRCLLALWLMSQMVFANSEPLLPEWDSAEREKMKKEGWIAGSILLTYESIPEENPEVGSPLKVEAPTASEIAEDSESGIEVSEEYLADYFAEKPKEHLVDPQGLLEERQKKDLSAFLSHHAKDSSIDIYIYVFGTNQEIPGDVREEEIVERLYSVGKPALVVYYYLGAPQRSDIYLSPIITDAVSAAEQNRALQSSVMRAFASVNPVEQLEAFLVQMSIRTYWMERMTEGTAEAGMEMIPEGEKARYLNKKAKASPEEMELPGWVKLAAASLIAACGAILAIWSARMCWHSKQRYRFPEFEVEPRLGGNHAAGVGAVISFSSSAVPPARQRDQVPNYMRRA